MTPAEAHDPLRTTDAAPSAAAELPAQTADPNAATRSNTDPQATASFQATAQDGKPAILPARSAPIPKVPGYEIIGVLGRGGMGVVYKARHLALKRLVALKMTLSGGHADERELQRFRAEAEAVARLQHPNIVQVHEVGEHEGLPYAALEFVEGGTLADRLKRIPCGFHEAARIVETTAAAVHLAHTRNIIHRDLKPANILLDAAGNPKVTDFGLARQLDGDSNQTRTGAVLGTPSYMSPEQAAGDAKHVGPAADVYALGAILYECLSGRPPFLGDSVVATLEMVRGKEPVAPHVLRVGAPRDLETICLKCLRKEPEKRYASADAMANDLRRWQSGEPIMARPVPAWERVVKWARRRPALAALIVAVHLFLASLLGLGIWSYFSIKSALGDANAAKLKSQRMSAGLAFDRGLQACQEGKVAEGLLWMAESLAVSPEEDDDFATVVRHNLAGWRAALTVQRSIMSHDSAVGCVAYSPDGTSFLSAEGGAVRRWDASTGAPLGPVMIQPSAVASVAWSPDGRLIATGCYDKTVRVWDVEKGKEIGPPIVQPDIVNAVVFSADGRLLVAATGFRDHSVPSSARVWEVATGKPATPPLPHPVTARSAVLAAGGRLVITGGDDGLIRYWETATGKLSGEPFRVGAQIKALAINGDALAIGCVNGEAYVYFVPDRRRISPPLRNTGPVDAIAFHPDGGLLATGSSDSFVRVWDWVQGKQISPPLVHQNYVNSVHFSPDGMRLISGSHDKTARQWDLPLTCQRGIPLVQSNPTLLLANLDPSLVSARPKTRVTGSQGRPIPHWVWEHLCAAFSLDGRFVVTGSIDSLGRVWEVASGRLVGKALPHQNWVRAVAFAPDNRRVLTGSHDMTARLWDVASGEPLHEPFHHSGEVVAVAIRARVRLT